MYDERIEIVSSIQADKRRIGRHERFVRSALAQNKAKLHSRFGSWTNVISGFGKMKHTIVPKPTG
jgi:hypothetical protein